MISVLQKLVRMLMQVKMANTNLLRIVLQTTEFSDFG